ncbi:MAG: adenine deaminase [Deltaproteobacteria bacterium]|nr:adenine deaminase [Deltaproteobacteria bacterium]
MTTEDELFSVKNLELLLKNPHVQSLGEITRWPEVIRGNPEIMEIIRLTKTLKKRVDGHTAGAIRGNPEIMEIIRLTKTLKKRVDGHTAGAKYEQLVVLSRAGVESCHEAISAEEALDRLRLGLHVMLRESSLRQDLADLLRVIKENRVLTDRIMLTTDGSTPAFYEQFGITDHILEIAIREGIDPVLAYRMVTINPAVYFGMDNDIGGIAPGRYADILILKDILHPTPEMVISKGRIAAKNGSLIEPFPRLNWETFFPSASFSRRHWSAKSHFFEIRSPRKRLMFPIIKLINPVITRTEWVEFDTKDGLLCLNEKDEFCYLALINRDGEWVTNGIIKGFGDGIEGIASSFNTATEILVIGRNPKAMGMAVNRVLEMKGGIVAVENGQIPYEFSLPLGGLMSDAPMKQLAQKDREFKEFLSSRGYPFHDPLYTLIFLPNDFLPDVRINYQGVVDIRKGKVIWPRRDLAEQ